MSKAIYQPSGKAKEYNQWAVNFYNGCTGKCTYCYNRKGRSAKLLGKDNPTIKKSLIDEKTALIIFEKEIKKYQSQLQEHGLFFNFVSDPFLSETELLNTLAMRICMNYDIPIIALTKQTSWVNPFLDEIKQNNTIWNCEPKKHLFTVGFTLTGHDELETGCSPNLQRIKAMQSLHQMGIRTWASIEPVIDIPKSMSMIMQSSPWCTHYKIGLESGKKFNSKNVNQWVIYVNQLFQESGQTIYWKDSITKHLTNETFNKVLRKDNPVSVPVNYKFWMHKN